MEKRTPAGMKKKTEYTMNWHKTHYKRIPLDVPHEMHNRIVAASQEAGESVNGYIKTAIDMRMNNGV